MPYRTFPVELIPKPRGLGPNPVARSGAPIALATKVTSIVDDTTRTFDSGALNPGNRFAYWIDEIRMLGTTDVGALATDYNRWCLGTLLRLKLHAGRHDLSKVFVPMWSYTPNFSRNGQMDDSGILPLGDPTVGAQQSVAFRWVLPKPLLMLPGESLGGQVQRINFPGGGTGGNLNLDAINMQATLAFVGRANAPGYKLPKNRNVPWVGFETASKSQPSPVSGTALPAPVVVQIGDSFRNPFTRQWVVQRFIMRPYVQWTANDFIWEKPSYSSVYVEDSLGYAVTPRDCPASVFVSELGSASWTYSRALLAREQMNMRITFPTTIWDPEQSEFPNYAAVDASMVGYREEDL